LSLRARLLLPLLFLPNTIFPEMVIAGNEIGLPTKSEWLPGKIKRGSDGKLYLDSPQAKIQATPKPAKKSINAKTLYKNWVALSWTPPTHYSNDKQLKDLAGYKVYYWTERNRKRKMRDVKNVVEYRLDNLDYGETYFFTVTAYNSKHVESNYSKVIPIKLERPTE